MAIVVFVILSVVAVTVGMVTASRLRSDFNAQVTTQAVNISNLLHPDLRGGGGIGGLTNFASYASVTGAAARISTEDGTSLAATSGAPYLGNPVNPVSEINGYRVSTVNVAFGPGGTDQVIVEYGLPVAPLAGEIASLELVLLLGVLIGTGLAFAAGAFVARRAIAPIAGLTAAASEIERTGNPDHTLPEPIADDEVAELSRTLSGMLASLSEARNETESMLERQRAFVADASHELRTPLTSVLANLELLVESLDGADRETANSALRSTNRMRRLVGDLLLLARADAGHAPLREPFDLATVVIEAASELEPSSGDHVLELDTAPTPVSGNRDDLQRVATNLIENALRHTPPGTHITASTRPLPDGSAELVVADDGPGIPSELRPELFARFVRGRGDRGGSFGLGLAIVAAVTQAHGGTVSVDDSPHGGARFTVRLPPAPIAASVEQQTVVA
ncbi:MAG TPA: HAMP domain-containing sensor histidine kinase [Solirubrobacteraceae bacterium]|nr:HAMP domain-containing sensor histidine kinase [Solirubrobacteraceae bacterium]